MQHRTTLLQWHRRPRAWLLSLALVMLVLMQSLGGVHAVLHHADAAGPGPQDSPFGLHAAHSVDCQLFDQLAHADLAWLPPQPWVQPSAATPVFLPAETPLTVRRTRHFRARDPPGQA